MYYGLVNEQQAHDLAKAVSRVLGNGKNNNAHLLNIETACAESQLGHYKDNTPDGAGRGFTQVDAGTFYWLKDKALEKAPGAAMRLKRSWYKKILNEFGIDLKRVEHSDLDYNPLLSLIFTRLRYLVVPQPIPTTRKERAQYWKTFYNSRLGKGTVEHYLKACDELLEPEK